MEIWINIAVAVGSLAAFVVAFLRQSHVGSRTSALESKCQKLEESHRKLERAEKDCQEDRISLEHRLLLAYQENKIMRETLPKEMIDKVERLVGLQQKTVEVLDHQTESLHDIQNSTKTTANKISEWPSDPKKDLCKADNAETASKANAALIMKVHELVMELRTNAKKSQKDGPPDL